MSLFWLQTKSSLFVGLVLQKQMCQKGSEAALCINSNALVSGIPYF